MALVIPILAGLALLILGLVGYLRDTRRGILALAGTLLGAILAGFWGAQWGQDLAKRVGGGDPRTLTVVANCAVFLFAVLFVGYAGGLLLRRGRDRPTIGQRMVGALMGVLNGALIVGYLLRFIADQNPAARTTLLATPTARAFHDGLPLLFLGIAGLVAALSLGRGIILIAGGGRAPQPSSTGAAGSQRPAGSQPAAGPAPAQQAAAQERQREVLDKVNRRL